MPVFLCCIIIFVVWLHYEKNKSSRKIQKISESFWEKEQQANFARKADISTLDYITIPVDLLPFLETTDEKLLSYQKSIQELASKTILSLDGATNTDVKLKYGNANLPKLSEYDQNYLVLIRTLYLWGDYLHQIGYTNEAITVLEYAVTCKSDVKNNYILLGKLYKEQGKAYELKELIRTASSLNSIRKNAILTELEELK